MLEPETFKSFFESSPNHYYMPTTASTVLRRIQSNCMPQDYTLEKIKQIINTRQINKEVPGKNNAVTEMDVEWLHWFSGQATEVQKS